jgi:hypothetical protein
MGRSMFCLKLRAGDRTRHRCPLPEEQRRQQPFLWDGRTLIAPWPPSRLALAFSDEQRLEAVTARLGTPPPSAVVWLWPDREPAPVGEVRPGWLAAWARDRACYRIAP